MKRPTSSSSSSSRATAKPGGIEHTLIFALTVLLLTYLTVTVRTFWTLSDDGGPLMPLEDVAAVVGSSDGHAAPISPDPFPVSIHSAEFETIVHPASEVMKKHDDGERDDDEITMDVPTFWDPPRFASEGGVRMHLGRHGERLMSTDEALSVGSLIAAPPPSASLGNGGTTTGGRSYVRKKARATDAPPLETIYVAIASYRDWQCTGTVENVFYRAAYPERIRVAVIDQIDASDGNCAHPTNEGGCETDPDQILCRHRDRIDVYTMDASLAVGPVFARHLGHRAYRGEYFAMQADAHVKFTQDWDVDIIGQWKSAKNEMAVLTAYLSDIQGSIDEETGKSLHKSRPIMCRTDYEGRGPDRHLRHGQQPEGVPGIHGTPTLEPYWAAGFSFARGHFVLQVPYDQHLPMIFQGEEISLGLRGFSYGYDYYTPERAVCFHMYAVGENKAKRKKVKLFWEHSNLYAGAGRKGMARLLGIIKMADPKADPKTWNHAEEDKYGLGKVRTTQKFFDLYGIHAKSRTVEQHLCRFVGKPMQAKFVPHLRKNGMGINYDEIDYRFKDPAPDEKPPPLNGR